MTRRGLGAYLVLLIACGLVAACGGEASPGQREASATSGPESPASPTVASAAPDAAAVYSATHELQGIAGWINSEPLTLADLKGKVVLLDFWTYTCVNCIRTFPFLREWHRKYGDLGLVIVGVHTPEFEFERRYQNVQAAAVEHGLTYPIAQGNEHATWSTFGVMVWPTKVIIGPDGELRYMHQGEGYYQETELKIRELLREIGADVESIPISTDSGPKRDPIALSAGSGSELTRELYGGFMRGGAGGGAYVINPEYYAAPNQELYYRDDGQRRNNFIFLEGVWRNGLESVRHARETENFEDYIGIEFFASSVNAVLTPESEPGFTVMLTLDGRPLTLENKGADVFLDESGKSFIRVDRSRMYRLVELPQFGGGHELLLSSNSSAFALYAFTFGSYQEGP